MHKIILLISSCLLMLACDRLPSTEMLTSKYFNASEDYELLREMIKVDTGVKDCFEVGLDHIGGISGNDYWKQTGSRWNDKNNHQTLSLSEVLTAVGLTEKRYQKYELLFASTGSERISYCQYNAMTSVLVYRSGNVVSGCMGTINWSQTPPPLSTGKCGKGYSNFIEIILLDKGWHV